MKILAVLLLLFCFRLGNAFAQGGPPLVTDDPGTPGDGHWEINSAVQWASSDPATVVQFPLFDINYGYGDHVQLNLNTSIISVTERGKGRITGLSLASLATKWRFIDEDLFGVAISTYPRMDLHHWLASKNPAVNSPGSRYFLPIEFAKTLGRWGLNPELGLASYSEGVPEWVYGLAVSYAWEKEKEALFEIHGRTRFHSDDQEWLYNFGTRFLLLENINFIGSFGRTFEAYSDQAVAWNLYSGLQLRF